MANSEIVKHSLADSICTRHKQDENEFNLFRRQQQWKYNGIKQCQMAMNTDLEDAHLCIKCKSTILGLENYIAHRKNDCNAINVVKRNNEKIVSKISNPTTTSPATTTTTAATTSIEFDAHPYRKTLDASYDLATELGADVFFSSLQLQSVESLAPHKSINPYQRQKSEQREHTDWIDTTFKSIEFTEHLPESSASSLQEDESEDELPHIPPTVPATHTGGKWKPEHRPGYTLRVSPYAQELSPAWDYNLTEEETYLPDIDDQSQHPPAEHTRGKWVPGSKMQVEYKHSTEEFWCKICCRKLKGKINYESHLKTNYHLKRAQPEQELEKAELEELQLHGDILNQILPVEQTEVASTSCLPTKHKRRKIYIKCELCKLAVQRHLIGKHLISHYHYRRMQTSVGKSYNTLAMILEHIHSIVLQSPFQCRPCCFYANTEELFLQHWKTAHHLEKCAGEGQFCCNFCQFQSNSNDIMYKHLIGVEHKEVLLAINRSVPISISKILNIKCSNCHKSYRYNMELRKHLELCHINAIENEGTASDLYQCIHKCELCLESFRSKISLQRHEKNKHNLAKYFCYLCNIQFDTALQAKRHRKTLSHRESRIFKETQELKEKQKKSENIKYTEENLSSVAQSAHIDAEHSLLRHVCPVCGKSFAVSQALGQHSRYCRVENGIQTMDVQISGQTGTELVKDSRIWRCKECDYSCSYESELIFHSVFHFYGSIGRAQKIKCPLCEKSFRKESLRCHLRLHTKDKIFVCEFCEAKFTRRHHLKTHTKKQHAEKSHIGIVALKQQEKNKFNETSDNDAHGMEHHQTSTRHQDSYICKKCNFRASTLQQLKSHYRRHLRAGQQRMHNCDKCEFKSSIKGHFERHTRMHTGEKPYQCPHCTFRCASLDNLRRHILNTKLHPGHYIYECKMCPNDAETHKYKTNFYNEYQQHLRNVHNANATVHFMQNFPN